MMIKIYPDIALLAIVLVAAGALRFALGKAPLYFSGYSNAALSWQFLVAFALLVLIISSFVLVLILVREWHSLSSGKRAGFPALTVLMLVMFFALGSGPRFPWPFLDGFAAWCDRKIDIESTRGWIATQPRNPIRTAVPIDTTPIWVQSGSPTAVELLPNDEGLLIIWRRTRGFPRYVYIAAQTTGTLPSELPAGNSKQIRAGAFAGFYPEYSQRP